MTPISKMVGANRIVTGNGIVHPVGDADASPEEEKQIRRRILEQALKALASPVSRPEKG